MWRTHGRKLRGALRSFFNCGSEPSPERGADALVVQSLVHQLIPS
jgi:hypothetical protein